jgi:hypothetical protein
MMKAYTNYALAHLNDLSNMTGERSTGLRSEGAAGSATESLCGSATTGGENGVPSGIDRSIYICS